MSKSYQPILGIVDYKPEIFYTHSSFSVPSTIIELCDIVNMNCATNAHAQKRGLATQKVTKV